MLNNTLSYKNIEVEFAFTQKFISLDSGNI